MKEWGVDVFYLSKLDPINFHQGYFAEPGSAGVIVECREREEAGGKQDNIGEGRCAIGKVDETGS